NLLHSTYFISFFFSSRRRHTRCLSDWSPDVCSSDLDYLAKLRSARSEIAHSPPTAFERGTLCSVPNTPHEITAPEILFWMEGWRSEERRVGKECRTRWAT